MLKEILGIVAAVMAVFAYVPYVRDILAGRTKPHLYSWLIWGSMALVIFALQMRHGGGPGGYTTGTVALMCLAVCLLSLRNGTTYITAADTAFFLAALIAVAVWLVAKQPTLSMVLLVSIDMLAVAPSLRKSWNRPHEETVSMWTINGVRHALSVFALAEYTLLTLFNPGMWAVMNLGFAAMLIIRRRLLALATSTAPDPPAPAAVADAR